MQDYVMHIIILLCPQTAATHTSRDLKTSVAISWTAPPAGTGLIGFRYASVSAVNSDCFLHVGV